MKKLMYCLLIPSVIFQLISNIFDSRPFFVDKTGQVVSNNLYTNSKLEKYQLQIKYSEDDIMVETIDNLDTYNKTINSQAYCKKIANDDVGLSYFIFYVISATLTLICSLFLIQMKQEDKNLNF